MEAAAGVASRLLASDSNRDQVEATQMRLTTAGRELAEHLLVEAVEAQQAMWHALAGLEELLGVEIDSTDDLSGLSIDSLLARK